jgi:hypothetical protein
MTHTSLPFSHRATNVELAGVSRPVRPSPVVSPDSLTYENDVGRMAQTSSDAGDDAPGIVAMISARRSPGTGRVETGKDTLAPPGGIAIDDGTWAAAGLLLDTDMTKPVSGAGTFSVNVATDVSPPFSPVGSRRR